MKPVRIKILGLFLTMLCGGLAWIAQAGTVSDQFNAGVDFTTGGVTNTIWDGVYLNSGDVPNGTVNGGSGLATTTIANETTFPGFLTIQTRNNYWNNQADDGFYLWKVVPGDFDVQVTVVNPFENGNYHMPGLLVRAFTTNGPAWGQPFATTGTTNLSENFLQIVRFNEFSIGDLVRLITNNADVDQAGNPANGFGVQFNTGSTNYNVETNDNRIFRITRVGDVFSFYDKTNDADAWVLEATNTRPDLSGIPMQVGINNSEFTANQFTTYFTNFVLSGPNVGAAVTPPTDPTGLAAAITSSSQITFSWTPGAGSSGSILVVRRNNPLVTQDKPIDGYTYAANTNYPGGDTLGAGAYVVYAGSGSSAVITGLGSVADNFYAAVYSYTNTGSTTIYGVSPSVTTTTGSQPITNLTLIVTPTSMPVNGGAAVETIVTFGDGSTATNHSGVVFNSTNTSVATVSAGGVSAIAAGASEITATYGGFGATNEVTVHNPAFTDNFSQNQDYVASGLIGSTWDGLFLNFGDVPGANKGPDNAAGHTSRLNSNVSSNGVLTVEAAGSTWYLAGNDGPYLFKTVTGDFQASVHVGAESIINNFDAGIMARLYNNSGGSSQGGGGGTGGTETHINWVKVQNGTPAVRRTIDSGGTTIINGLSATDGWLLMVRNNSTNFYMFESSNPTNNGWTLVSTLVVPEAAGNAPMEVGIEQEMRSAADGSGQLDTWMLDGPGITPPATPPPPATNLVATLNTNDLSMTFSWVAADTSGNPIRSMLIMRPGGPVTAFPTLAQAGSIGGTGSPVTFGASGLNLGGENWMVFATGNPAASTNVTCTVKGLTPGTVYYAAVVTFTGVGGTKSFNNIVVPSSGAASLQDGTLQSVYVLPPPTIPRGGIGQLQVIGIFGGQPVNVSQFATLIPANQTIIVTTNGVLTGLTNGTSAVTVIYSGFTNSVNATVRDPGFTDNYTNSQDYLLNGVAGTPYDGLYNPNANTGVQVPESYYGPLAGSGAVTADANITSNGVFTLNSAGDGWENDAAGGFFLFKYVPGDFQAAVHISTLQVAGYNQPGLLARAYSTGTNNLDFGSPLVLGIHDNGNGNNGNAATTNGETWVDLSRFDEFGIGTYARLNLDSSVLQSIQLDQGDGFFWLLVVRSQGTNFNFYMRATNNAPWQLLPLQTSYQQTQFAGVPMQVGIMAGPWTGGSGTPNEVQFDSYMLDEAPPVLSFSSGGGNINLSWPAVPAISLQQSLGVSPSSWQPAVGTLTTNTESITLSVPMTNSAAFYRLVSP